jgi:GNAT superfamily N-acetyltransferase
VVDDEHQGAGVGRLLSEAVASMALSHGCTRLRAEMAEDNAAMVHLMTRLGPTARSHEGGSVLLHTRLPADRRLAVA